MQDTSANVQYPGQLNKGQLTSDNLVICKGLS